MEKGKTTGHTGKQRKLTTITTIEKNVQINRINEKESKLTLNRKSTTTQKGMLHNVLRRYKRK